MKHLLHNAITILSLLLCIVTLGLWIHSYWYNDAIFWGAAKIEKGVMTWRGRVRIFKYDESSDPDIWGGAHGPSWSSSPGWVLEPPSDESVADAVWYLPTSEFKGLPIDPETATGWHNRIFAGVDWFHGNFRHINVDDDGLIKPAWALTISLFYPAAIFAIAPTWWIISYGPLKRRRRRRLGQCVTCRYDLRASPTRCPECGTATTNEAKS